MACCLDASLRRFSDQNPQAGPHLTVFLVPAAYQALLAATFVWLLPENLKRRKFALAG
jgi:hypothetical protein